MTSLLTTSKAAQGGKIIRHQLNSNRKLPKCSSRRASLLQKISTNRKKKESRCKHKEKTTNRIRRQANKRVALNLLKLGLNAPRQDVSMVSLCRTILGRLISRTMVNGSLISSKLWPEKYLMSNQSSSRHRGDLTFGIRCRARMIMKMRRRRGGTSTSALTCTTYSR